jgi:hypothetical protein
MTFRVYFNALLFLAVFIGANAFSLQPGVGSGSDERPGTEFERFLGFPATYRAELWESDDPNLAQKILAKAPFYSPHDEMKLRHGYSSVAALAVNVLVGLMGIALIALHGTGALSLDQRPPWGAILIGGIVVCFMLSPHVSTHL